MNIELDYNPGKPKPERKNGRFVVALCMASALLIQCIGIVLLYTLYECHRQEGGENYGRLALLFLRPAGLVADAILLSWFLAGAAFLRRMTIVVVGCCICVVCGLIILVVAWSWHL